MVPRCKLVEKNMPSTSSTSVSRYLGTTTYHDHCKERVSSVPKLHPGSTAAAICSGCLIQASINSSSKGSSAAWPSPWQKTWKKRPRSWRTWRKRRKTCRCRVAGGAVLSRSLQRSLPKAHADPHVFTQCIYSWYFLIIVLLCVILYTVISMCTHTQTHTHIYIYIYVCLELLMHCSEGSGADATLGRGHCHLRPWHVMFTINLVGGFRLASKNQTYSIMQKAQPIYIYMIYSIHQPMTDIFGMGWKK